MHPPTLRCDRKHWSKSRLKLVGSNDAGGFKRRDGALRGKLKKGRATVEFNKHIVNGSKETMGKREPGPAAKGTARCPKGRAILFSQFALTDILLLKN